ncbi:hypothetical protein LVY75_35615 (plasmid) [Sinorhizobium sp. B11]
MIIRCSGRHFNLFCLFEVALFGDFIASGPGEVGKVVKRIAITWPMPQSGTIKVFGSREITVLNRTGFAGGSNF